MLRRVGDDYRTYMERTSSFWPKFLGLNSHVFGFVWERGGNADVEHGWCQQNLRTFAAGSVEAVLELFDPAIEWFAAREFVRWRIAARYRGLNQVVGGVPLGSENLLVWQFR